jgi:hypothetical protein
MVLRRRQGVRLHRPTGRYDNPMPESTLTPPVRDYEFGHWCFLHFCAWCVGGGKGFGGKGPRGGWRAPGWDHVRVGVANDEYSSEEVDYEEEEPAGEYHSNS